MQRAFAKTGKVRRQSLQYSGSNAFLVLMVYMTPNCKPKQKNFYSLQALLVKYLVTATKSVTQWKYMFIYVMLIPAGSQLEKWFW